MNIDEMKAGDLTKHASEAGEAALNAMFSYMDDNDLMTDIRVAVAVGTTGAVLLMEAIREANRETLGSEKAMETELRALDIVAAFKEVRDAKAKEE